LELAHGKIDILQLFVAGSLRSIGALLGLKDKCHPTNDQGGHTDHQHHLEKGVAAA
jgi:hypothetical protein